MDEASGCAAGAVPAASGRVQEPFAGGGRVFSACGLTKIYTMGEVAVPALRGIDLGDGEVVSQSCGVT